MNNEFGNRTCDFARFCVEQAARHDPDLQTEYLEIKNCTLHCSRDYLLILLSSLNLINKRLWNHLMCVVCHQCHYLLSPVLPAFQIQFVWLSCARPMWIRKNKSYHAVMMCQSDINVYSETLLLQPSKEPMDAKAAVQHACEREVWQMWEAQCESAHSNSLNSECISPAERRIHNYYSLRSLSHCGIFCLTIRCWLSADHQTWVLSSLTLIDWEFHRKYYVQHCLISLNQSNQRT